MADLIVHSIIGCMVTGMFALVAYLFKRLIDQNDKFQDETTRTVRLLRKSLARQGRAIGCFKQEIEKRIDDAGVDKETKTKIASLALDISKVEKELSTIKPSLLRAEETSGTVIWLKEKFLAQEEKLLGLYDSLKELTQKY